MKMQERDHIYEQEHCFADSIAELQKVNKQLAKLNLRKEELVNQIIGLLHHEHEGQKAYEYRMWKIEVKTPFIYCLNIVSLLKCDCYERKHSVCAVYC